LGQPHATLTVGAAGRGLVRAGGVLRLCPGGSRYALAASGFALAALATRSRLLFCTAKNI
jgi:hypothetical protein